MSIPAAQVKELRDRTGAGMMDCKRALAESGGDMEAAMDFLRRKGLAVAEKRKGRAMKEGLIRLCVDRAAAVMVEVNCETDFVSRNEEFKAFADAVAKQAAQSPGASLEDLLAQPVAAGGRTVQESITDLMGKIGENMAVSRLARVALDGPGVIESYLHAGGRVGVLVALGAPSAEIAAKPEVRGIAHDIALHVAFASPLCVDRAGVPAELVERERKISRERALEQGKPEKIIDKIVEGQINKYHSEVVLLEQPYIREEKTAVKKWLEAQGKALGVPLEVNAFARFALGEATGDEEGE